MIDRDTIIRMAREVGAVSEVIAMGRHSGILFTQLELEHFAALIAALVAAAERDRVCKIVYGLCISDNNAFEIVQAIKAVTEKGASNHDAERNDSTG